MKLGGVGAAHAHRPGTLQSPPARALPSPPNSGTSPRPTPPRIRHALCAAHKRSNGRSPHPPPTRARHPSALPRARSNEPRPAGPGLKGRYSSTAAPSSPSPHQRERDGQQPNCRGQFGPAHPELEAEVERAEEAYGRPSMHPRLFALRRIEHREAGHHALVHAERPLPIHRELRLFLA